MTHRDICLNRHSRSTRLLARSLVFLLAVNPLILAAGTIVTNGKTQTSVSTTGTVSSVTTKTISGNSGFNSFSQFDVDQVDTVNLYLPGSTRNLVNLVYDKRSDINGIVNSIKDGRIGGNLYFANPYGIIVGKDGSINTGSLSLSAPSHSFMQSVFDGRGDLAPIAVTQLLAGDIPLSDSGLISIRGKINAINDINVAAATVEHSGIAVTGANFQSSAIDFSDLVNVNGVESAGSMAINNGVIEIFATELLTVDGQLYADGGNGVDGGEIYLDSDGDINLNSGAMISARGKGDNSNGGTIISMAQDSGVLAAGVQMNAAAGDSGDGGFIEFSAVEHVSLQGGLFNAGATNGTAGLVYIDPPTIDISGLNLLDGETNILIEADETVTILTGAIVSSRRIVDENNGAAHLADASIGHSGDIAIWAPNINIADDVQILAHAIGGGWEAGDVLITNLRPIDVDSVDPTHFEVAGFSLADVLGEGNDLQGLIDELSLDEKDISRLLNVDSSVSIAVGVDGGAETIIKGKDIEILGYASDRFGFVKNATAEVSVFNSRIEGENILIQAEADTGLYPQLFDKTDVNVAGVEVNPNFFVDNYMGSLGIPDSAFYVDTSAIALTTISGALTVIDAEDSLSIQSLAINSANPFSLGFVFGLEIVDASTDAMVEIVDDASLVSASIELGATAKTKTTADSDVAGVALPGTFSLSLTEVEASSRVSSDGTANLEADSISYRAKTETETTTTAKAQKSGGAINVVTALAISDVVSTASTLADGEITSDSLDLEADVTSKGNTTRAMGGSSGGSSLSDKFNNLKQASQGLVLNQALAPLTSKNGTISDLFFPQVAAGKLNIAGAIAIAETTNTATASLGPTANVIVDGKVTIDAKISDAVRIAADVAATSEGNALGGAVTVGDYTNTAEAYLDTGAQLSAEEVDIDSSTRLAYPWDFDYKNLEKLYNKLTGSWDNFLFTASAFNKNKSEKAGASASINSIAYTANARSYIGDGAIVTVTDGGTGTVAIDAATDTNIVTVSGKNPLSKGSSAIGGSVNVVTIGGETLSYIANNAVVNTDLPATNLDLNLTADAAIGTINIAESGGSSDKLGVDGAVAFLEVDQITKAYIASNAAVTGDTVSLLADTDVALWNIAGGFVRSGAAGIGLSYATNDIDVTTKSYIGEDDDDADVVPLTNTVTADSVSLDARADGVMDAISIAGAIVSSSDKTGFFGKISAAKDKVGGLLDAATASVNAQRSSNSSDGSSGGGSTSTPEPPKPTFGVGISGSASVNEVALTTEAKLQQAKVATAQLAINSVNHVDIDAGSGSGSFVKAKASGVKNSAAFAGAFAYNDIANTTRAMIADSAVTGTEHVEVRALSGGEQLSVGLGLAVNASGNSGNSASIAGSVSLSNTSNSTTALISDSTVEGDGSIDSDLDVVAYDKTELGVGAGSLFYGGKGGVGAAISLSEIANSIIATIDNSTVNQFNMMQVRALNAARIGTGAGMAGGGSGTSSLAGSFVFSEISNSTRASVSGGSLVMAAGAVVVAASDVAEEATLDSIIALDGGSTLASEVDYEGTDVDANDSGGNSIVAVAGLIQVGKNNVGVSLVKSDINNSVTADIDDSTVTGSSVAVDAKANTAITGIAIGVGGGTGKLAANGSVVLSSIQNENSAVTSDATITGTTLHVKASDQSSIDSLAGNIAASAKTAIGASVAFSDIDNTTNANIQNGAVDVSGAIVVDANTNSSIQNLAAAGGGAGSVAVGVSLSVNEIDNATVAGMDGVQFDQTANSLSVKAEDESIIQSLAGTINGAGKAAAGAAVSINTIGNTATASIDDTTTLDVLVSLAIEAVNESAIDSIAVAGGGAGTGAFNGSASTNFIANLTEARLNFADSVSAVASLTVTASDESTIQSLAGSVGGAGTGAVGAAVAINDIANQVDAKILASDIQAAVTQVQTNTIATITSMAVAGSGAGTFAVNGSVATNFISNNTTSLVDELVYLAMGESLAVNASDESTIQSLGGSISFAGTAAVGAAVTVNDINNDVIARITGSQLNLSDQVLVDADSQSAIETIAVAGGGSGTAAVGGSASTNFIESTTLAEVLNTDYLAASEELVVSASDESSMDSLAGSVQGSGVAAVGAAAAINDIGSNTSARVAGSTINTTTSTSVLATTNDSIQTLAVAGGGSGTAAVGGSVATNFISNETTADITNSDQLSNQGDITISAADESIIQSLSGSVQASGVASVGAAVAVNRIANKIKAFITGVDTDLLAVNVAVDSTSDATIETIAVGASVSGTVGVAGSVAVNLMDNEVETYIDDGASVIAQENVAVRADSSDDINVLAGAVAIGVGGAGLGATVSVNEIEGSTQAYIRGAGTSVTALANSTDGLGLSNGIVDFNFGDLIGSQADRAEDGEDGDGASASTYEKLDLTAQINTDTENTGVTINATSRQNIDALGATAGVGLYGGLGATANVNVIGGETKAYIDSASVNDQAGADSRQKLAVVAEDHTYTNAFVGAIGGGAAGLGAAVDTTVIDRSTQAYIIDASHVEAESGLTVKATATQGANSIAVGGAGGGVALAASGSVLKFDADTAAYIQDSDVDAGSVIVEAIANNQSSFYDFAAAFGAALGGAGTFGVNLMNNNTSASIEGSAGTPLVLRSAGAVTVNAESSTRNDAKVISFAASSGGFGVAGMAAVNVITSNTEAKLNNVDAGSSPARLASLTVTAADEVILDGLAGAAGVGGGAGIGAGATVNIVKSRVIADVNNTNAFVVDAVTVDAQSSKLADNITATAGAGLTLGVGGSALVNLFGAEVEGDSAEELNRDNNGTLTKVDDLAGGSKTELLEGQDEDTISANEIAALDDKTQSDVKTVATTASTGDSAYRTGAAIGGISSITSGSVNVNAQDSTTASALVGGVAIGAVGVGGAFALTEVKNNIAADITESVSINAANVNLSASAGKVAGQNHVIDTDVFAGAGGIVGVGAAVGIANIQNNVSANLAADVSGNTAINVSATDTGSMRVDAKGAAVGSGAVGVVVAESEKNTTVNATVGGSNPYSNINSLTISAENSGSVTALSKAGAAGMLFAGTGADSRATDNSYVSATTADASEFDLGAGSMILTALTTPDVYAESIGVSVSGGIKIGASFAKAESNQTVIAALGAANQVTANTLSLLATNALAASGHSARANSVGAGGGLLLGLNATNGTAVNTINVDSHIGTDSNLVIGSALNVNATNTSSQRADVTGINGGILAAGFNESEANTTSLVEAYVGNDVGISGGNVSVVANSDDRNYADSVSGSGGVVSGSASEANTFMSSVTNAYMGDDTANKTIVIDSLAINATHTSKFNAKVNSTNASLVGASGASASNFSVSTVEAALGTGLEVSTGQVDIDANNIVEKLLSGWNVNSGSGGLLDLPAASSTTSISNNTEVNVGANTVLAQTGSRFAPGTFELDALNDVSARDKVKMNAGGAIALAKGKSIINATINNASVNIGQGAVVQALGDLNIGAKANADIGTTVAVDVFGLAGAPFGDAISNFVAANAVNISDDAQLLSLNDVILGAGVDTQGNENNLSVFARTDLWNNSALPLLHDPVADALIRTANSINVGTDADVAAVRNIVMKTKQGNTSISGVGIGKDIYSETLSEVVNGVGGAFGAEEVSFDRHGGSETNTSINTVNVDGTARVGIQSKLALEIDINGNVTRWVNGEVTNDPDEGIRILSTYTTNVAEDIRTRIDDLRDLISEYATESSTSDAAIAVAAYEAEITFLEHKLEELGLAADNPGGFNGVRQTQLELANLDLDSFNTEKTAKENEQSGYETDNTNLGITNAGLVQDNIDLEGDNVTLSGNVTTWTAARAALDPDDGDYTADYNAYTLQITTANGQIGDNNTDIGINEGVIGTNETTIATNTGLIGTLQTDIDGLEVDIDSVEMGIANGIYLDSVDSLDVNVIVIDDTTAQLGNIYVFADTLGGDGNMIAPGDAEIVITNNSANYLELNNLVIPSDDGGTLYFNNVSVTDNAEIDNINSAGNVKSILAGMSAAVAGFTLDTAEVGVLPKIEIISNYDPTLSSNALRVPNVGPDIIVSAGNSSTDLTHISNARGSVVIQSAAGNIRLEENTLVSGATVEVKARNGDFIQSYTDAFSHIVGGEPLTFTQPLDPDALSTIAKNTLEGTGNGIVANGSVLIAARYLNINGVIQSGIPEWGVSIPDAALVEGNRTFAQAQAHYDGLSDVEKAVDGAEFYTVEGANVTGLDAGVWGDWEQITVEYNAIEDRLELGGVQVSGGYIQIFGQVFNTNGAEVAGGARLRVLDGYGEIKVDNQTTKALFLNTLDAGQGVEGKISITNVIGQNVDGSPILENTVYTRGGGARTGTTFDPDSYLAGGERLEYSMSNGDTATTIEKYLYSINSWFNVDALSVSEARSGKWISGYTATDDPLAKGEFLKISTNNTYDTAGVNYVRNTETTSETLSKDGEGWVDCNWWTLCANADHYQRYKIETGSKSVNTYSIHAGNPIAIEFIGFDEGTIDVQSTADVLISGALINRSGDTNIVSRDGRILQTTDFANVAANNVTLTAEQGIGTLDRGINVVGLDGGVFRATTNTGDIHIIKETGDMVIEEVSTNDGRVLLDVGGDINGVGALIDSTGDVIANRIELISRNGAIGSTRDLKIQTGYTADPALYADYGLEALARDDISIVNVASAANASGHLMLASVESLAGDVTLQTEGTFIDNNQIERSDTRAIAELVSLWDDMQLRGASADAKDVREIEILEDSVTAEYRRYWDTRLSQDDPSAYDPGYVTSLSADQETVMRAQLALRDNDGDGIANTSAEIDSAIAGYIVDRSSEYHAQHIRLYDATSENGVQGFVAAEFDEGFRYTAANTEVSDRTEGSHWSDFQLALSVSSSLLKELTDTVTVIEEPNVKGRHVTLISSGGDIGTISPINFDLTRTNALDFTAEEKAALASAERGDITVFADYLTINQRDDADVELIASGSLFAQADTGNIYLGSEKDIALRQIIGANEIRLKVAGSLSRYDSPSSLVNIFGQRTILEAGHGAIGAANNALLVNLAADAPLTARAADSIFIEETDGDINVDTLFSREQITLVTGGSIVDAFNDGAVNISANGITLTAGGDVGETDDALEVSVADEAVVDVDAVGDVNLNGDTTRLGIGSIVAANVQVGLGIAGGYLRNAIAATGFISVDGSGDWHMFSGSSTQSAVATIDIAGDLLMEEAASISADQVSLNSAGVMVLDDIAANDALMINAGSDIDVLASAVISSAENVRIDAGGDFTMIDGSSVTSEDNLLVNVAGDMRLANLTSHSTSDTAIDLVAGQQIIDAGDIDTDIVAVDGGLLMSAGTGIGIGDPLEVNVKFATLNAENGDITINSDTDLELNARAENGSVIASASGVLTTGTGIYASDSADLSAGQAIRVNPLTVGVGASLTSVFIDAMVTQIDEAEASIIFNVVGAAGQASSTNLQVNAANGVAFNRLWSNDADIVLNSNKVSVLDGQSDSQVLITTPLTALQIENRSVGRKSELDLQLYSKDKSFSFVLDDGRLSTNDMVIGNSLTHSVDSPLGQDKDLMRYVQQLLQSVEPEAASPTLAEYVLQVLDSVKNPSRPLISVPEDPGQLIQLDEQALNVEEEINDKAIAEETSDLKISAIY
jgi:filamentous hemagglutinin family protein